MAGRPAILAVAAVAAVATVFAGTADASVLHVDADAPPGGDGTSWAAAFADLGRALTIASHPVSGVTEIWVAEGTYRPAEPGGDRAAAFRLADGVALYGGFAGDETSLEQRDWMAHETVLSGDLNGDDRNKFENYGDNSYHVVTAQTVTAGTRVDGVTITASHADGSSSESNLVYGGGLFHVSGPLDVAHCRIHRNLAGGGENSTWGAGAHVGPGPVTFTECVFEHNASTDSVFAGGAAIYVDTAEVTVDACVFRHNLAFKDVEIGGYGAVFVRLGHATVTGCTFEDNDACVGSLTGSATLIECAFIRNFVAINLDDEPYQEGTLQVVRDCVFTDNEVCGQLTAWEIEVTGCVFSGHRLAGLDVRATVGQIADCQFADNSTPFDWGGGAALELNGDVHVSACDFTGNISTTPYNESRGGAVWVFGDAPVFESCTFVGNRAVRGGAICFTGGTPQLIGCVFRDNIAETLGGALYYEAPVQAPNWATPELIDCVFEGNRAAYGGGACFDYETMSLQPTITGCRFADNHVHALPWPHPSGSGGGLAFYSIVVLPTSYIDASITDCEFEGNTAVFNGAGVSMLGHFGSVDVSGCTFSANTAGRRGGAVEVAVPDVALVGCHFEHNVAERGGAAFVYGETYADPQGPESIVGCVFRENAAWLCGAALQVRDGDTLVANCLFQDNIVLQLDDSPFCDNGGIIYLEDLDSVTNTPQLLNNTITGNWSPRSAAVVTLGDNPSITNSIIWGNTGPPVLELADGFMAITYSDIEGGWAGPGAGNIDADPIFTDPATGDFRLGPGSPCIDAGDASALPADTLDLDGDRDVDEPLPVDLVGGPRVVGENVDQGALEAGSSR